MSFPMPSAMLTKYVLNISATAIGSLTRQSFSRKNILFLFLHLVLKNGFTVFQKDWFFGPPSHRSLKYIRCDNLRVFSHLFFWVFCNFQNCFYTGIYFCDFSSYFASDSFFAMPHSSVNWASLVHVMACCLFGTKPLPELMLTHCQLDPQE